MKVTTNLTPDTIARYNAMNWNHHEDIYCLAPCGDCWHEILRDTYAEDPAHIITKDELVADTEWQIGKHETIRDDDFMAACHNSYKEGWRDAQTVEGEMQYRAATREIAAYKRALAAWVRSAETCEPYTFDTDDIRINFDKAGRAVAR